VVGQSAATYHFACQVCEGSGTVDVGDDDEPSSRSAGPVPAARATIACRRCQRRHRSIYWASNTFGASARWRWAAIRHGRHALLVVAIGITDLKLGTKNG
jgi:hypothetical protein